MEGTALIKRIFIYSSSVICILIFISLLSSFLLHVIEPNQSLGKMQKVMKSITGEENIQINILNSTETKGIASKARDYLIKNGFDVVDVGNINKIVKKSFIIDRIGDSLSSHKVAVAIGIPDSLIVKKIDSTLSLRSSIIIGEDFKELILFKEKKN